MAASDATLLRKSNMKNNGLIDTKNITSFGTIYWSYKVKNRTGNISFRKIQLKLFPDYKPKKLEDTHDAAYSRRLYKNSRGTPVRDEEIIIRAENLYPGTQRLILHVLWDILENPVTTLDEVRQCMHRLDIDCVQRLFNIDKDTKIVIRKKLRKETLIRIAMKNDIDALTCLLLIIRETELTKNISANLWCRWCVHNLIARLVLFSPWSSLGLPFIDTLYELFIENSDIPIPEHIKEFRLSLATPNRELLQRSLTLNLDLLEAMRSLNLISSSDDDEQLNFLFWIDLRIDKYLLLSALKRLPKNDYKNVSPSALPEILNQLLDMVHGDSRRFIPQGGFH